jgi:hypothetical protein
MFTLDEDYIRQNPKSVTKDFIGNMVRKENL